jgi:hypothetical protein
MTIQRVISQAEWMLTLLLSIASLCHVAAINGYPVVFYDTAWYVGDLFYGFTDGQKALGYGYLLRITGGSFSLWGIVIFQAVCVTVMFGAIWSSLGLDRVRFSQLVVVPLLCLLSSLSWVTSQVMPEVFTALLVISLFVLISSAGQLSRVQRVTTCVVYVISIAVHASNQLLSITLLLTLFFARIAFGERAPNVRQLLLPLKLTLLSYLVVGGLSYNRTGTAQSRSVPYALLVNRMLEDGIVQKLLAEHCSEKNYVLCEHRDLLTRRRIDFLFRHPEVFGKIGGWKNSEAALKPIILDALRYYPFENIRAVGRHMLEQLIKFDSVSFIFQFPPGSPLSKAIKKHYPREFGTFTQSRQNREQLGSPMLSRAHTVTFWLSFLILLISFGTQIFWKEETLSRINAFSMFALFAVLENALICGALSHAEPRYGARVAWIVPLCALLILICWKDFLLRRSRTLYTRSKAST